MGTNQEQRVAVITGGSRGIGRAVSVTLAREGYSVCVNFAGNRTAAEETIALCKAAGVEAIAIQADISNAAQCEGLIQQVMETFGRIDVLVNNAGITRDGLLMRMREADFEAVLDTNLKGAFLATKQVTRIMMKQRYGRIINMSSVVGLRGNMGQSNYAASKAGLIGFSKSMAKELASRGITVNVVAPGLISTDMTDAMPEQARQTSIASIPMKQAGSAEDVAHAVAFFAAPESGYITGQVLCVDGGMAV
ncbi:MAG: 3-oxoacyl-[acyl-carrier-protein] reductase [Faecalibacterium sp.]